MRDRCSSLAVFMVVAVLLAPRLGLAIPPNPIKTLVTLPVVGVVYHPSTAEQVAVSGSLLVKTNVIPPNPIKPPSTAKVFTSYKLVSGATAIGQTSGDMYALEGKGKMQAFLPYNPLLSDNPCRTLTHSAIVSMIPPNPVLPAKGFRVLYQVNFDGTGLSTGAAAIVVPETDAPCAPVATVCDQEQPLVTLCADGVRNQDESDVDCGGSVCASRCPLAASCAGNTDCASSLCDQGVCVACLPYAAACSVAAQCCSGVPCTSGNCRFP